MIVRITPVTPQAAMGVGGSVAVPAAPPGLRGPRAAAPVGQTLTGMGILESSLPMQFFMMLHRFRL